MVFVKTTFVSYITLSYVILKTKNYNMLCYILFLTFAYSCDYMGNYYYYLFRGFRCAICSIEICVKHLVSRNMKNCVDKNSKKIE